MGLGQAHGAEKTPRQHRLGVAAFLLVGAMGENQVSCRNSQPGVALSPYVGSFKHPYTHLGNRTGQLHATALVVLAGRHQTSTFQYVQRLVNFRAHVHTAILEGRLFFIHQASMGCELLCGNFQRQVQRRLQRFTTMVLITLESEHLLYFMKLIKLESQVPGTYDFLLHDGALRLYHFEQAGCALTAANAHGDHHIFGTRPLPSIKAWPGRRETLHTKGWTTGIKPAFT